MLSHLKIHIEICNSNKFRYLLVLSIGLTIKKRNHASNINPTCIVPFLHLLFQIYQIQNGNDPGRHRTKSQSDHCLDSVKWIWQDGTHVQHGLGHLFGHPRPRVDTNTLQISLHEVHTSANVRHITIIVCS